MNVYWLEQTSADLPDHDDWLNTTEINLLRGLPFAKRRTDWRLGRWTAKRALALYLNLLYSPRELTRIEIRPAPSGAPEAIFQNRPASATISLSHSHQRAICAVAPSAVSLGCDLEWIEARNDAFVTDYFTGEEQALVMRHSSTERPLLLALLWSAKESALKALREGLRLDTRAVAVDPMNLSLGFNTWHPLQVRYEGGQRFQGWWQTANGMVRTVVAAPPPVSLVPLKVAAPKFGETIGACAGGGSKREAAFAMGS